MTIRTASLSKQIKKNGARLHQAMASRAHSQGSKAAALDTETALRAERDELKKAQADRRAAALLPKAKPEPVAKVAKAPKAPKAPKAAKEPKAPKEAKGAKGAKPSRADKLVKKAENAEAAKKADRKSATKK